MKVVKKTAEYTIYQKRSGRHAVKGADKQWINGEDKAKILLEENLIKLTAPAPAPVEEEAPAEEVAESVEAEATAEAGEVAEEPQEEAGEETTDPEEKAD